MKPLHPFLIVAGTLLLSVLISGCAMLRPQRETPPTYTLTFAGVREEVRLQFDPVTLEPAGSITNRFVFPVAYTVEGDEALDHLQVLFDRWREAQGLLPVSIHDDSAIGFFDLLDTRGGTVLPDFTIRQADVDAMTPLLMEPWLRKIKQDADRLRGGGELPRPRKDRASPGG